MSVCGRIGQNVRSTRARRGRWTNHRIPPACNLLNISTANLATKRPRACAPCHFLTEIRNVSSFMQSPVWMREKDRGITERSHRVYRALSSYTLLLGFTFTSRRSRKAKYFTSEDTTGRKKKLHGISNKFSKGIKIANYRFNSKAVRVGR